VAVGDFNGDGIPDLAVANAGTFPSYDGTVSVLLGNGDGTFQPAQSYAAGSRASSVAVGDFNGDGHLDLAVANAASNDVSVLLGNGDGTFQPARNFSAGRYPQSVAVGDFNGDGLLDLVFSNGTLLLGNGDGTFQAPISLPVSGFSVAVGDFNADGLLDLAVANFASRNVSVLLGNGDGTFQAARIFSTGADPLSVAVADFDGDGHLDLVVTNFTSPDRSTVSVLLGNGDGTFQAARNFSFAGSNPFSVAVGDFNGDGHLDLAVADAGYYDLGQNVSVLLGNGDGTFQTARNFPAGSHPSSVAVGDFNGDGFPDLAVANPVSNAVSILLNDGVWLGASPTPGGGGRFPAAAGRPRTAPVSLALAVEDLVRPGPGVPATAPPFGRPCQAATFTCPSSTLMRRRARHGPLAP
jgi:hypothetical protein